MGKYIDFYYKNNRLYNMVDYIIMKNFGWLPQKEYDDFYSIAGQTLWYCEEHFDKNKDTQFETYLIGSLMNKFKTQITYMNRKRRSSGVLNLSLDALINDNDMTLMNMVFTIDEPEENQYSDKMTSYLNKLSSLQKQILFDMAEGYSNDEIKCKHGITSKEFSDACLGLKAYKNVSVLF